ncbi:DUF2142 domain-containing protein [Cellulomonas sp.]|uniref:DUF2142 domain-containing protein n=1 Tax=Cellulomonas sp. TaxID=40001 RepID=UPI002810DC8B|nr:DUF2142 domain-containing protein [Cellulomonas sp.]
MSTSRRAAAPARRPVGAALRWVGVGALLFALTALWSLAAPPMASPDEPSHVVKAAAVARGQLSGTPNDVEQSVARPGVGTLVRLPSDFADALSLPNCFAFQQDVPADCQADDLPPARGEVLVETFAGQYPPLYYALVGWPSLFLAAEPSILAMRLVSALVGAALVTWGAYRLTTIRGNRAGLLGAAVATTPMCLFLMGTVNPAGLEIAAAFSFWAACLALVARGGPVTTAALVQAVVSGALLVNSRASAPVWAVGIVVVALVAAPRGRWREIVRLRAVRWLAPVAVLTSAGAAAWVLAQGEVVTTSGLYPHYADRKVALLDVLGEGWTYLQNVIGNFGWLDAPAPPLTFVLWLVALGVLLPPAAGARGPLRPRVALGLAIAGVAAAPVVLQVPTMADTGLIWQGRYVLPFAVGVPVLAALVLRVDATATGDATRRTARTTVLVLLVAHVAAFYWGSRRYAVGLQGELVTLTPPWSSPVGYLPGVALYALLAGALAAVLWHYYRPSTLSAAALDAPPLDAPAASGAVAGGDPSEPTPRTAAHGDPVTAADGARTA